MQMILTENGPEFSFTANREQQHISRHFVLSRCLDAWKRQSHVYAIFGNVRPAAK